MDEKTIPDLKPRHEDIDIMRGGLEKPWLLPNLAHRYAEKYFPDISLPPYEHLNLPMTEAQLKKRWASLVAEDKEKATRQLQGSRLNKKQNSSFQSPFGKPLSEIMRPKSKVRGSVVFIHHSYYHFYYLASALRDRGWNAWCISLEDPEGGNAPYYHGEDLNLWHEESATRHGLQQELFEAVYEHFDMIHFHGDSKFSIFDKTLCYNNERDGIGWDFLELKARGVKIGHSISGCLTGQRKSVFNKVSRGVCNKCVWQNRPDVCSEAAQYQSGERIKLICDLNALEVDWPGDVSRRTKNCFYDPLTYCFNEQLWNPDIEIPKHIERFKRKPGELLVFHAVGNLKDRQSQTKNIKGTPAVLAAMKRLKKEGHKVKLIFKTGVLSKDMRFYQIQADIIVDQINYGRYGATARETMALGVPTICHINPEQPDGIKPSLALNECPLVDATEETIYDVLKDLVANPEKRKKAGEAGRAYAMKWHSSAACAERFERVYDRMMASKYPLDVDEVYE
ncbi:MAG: glycosyltransferase family 4 protein [Robiginitomaculum sp.]|nr:glycosyltransferase family 4 protein [Robiginitomaculum sp.]